MNEAILINLLHKGDAVVVNSFSGLGIVLFGETSAWPRRVGLRMEPLAGAAVKMQTVRRRHDWSQGEEKYNVNFVGSQIRITGVDSESLPSGIWEVDWDIHQLKGPGERRVEIPRDGTFEFDLPVRPDSRTITVRPKSSWSAPIRRVMEDSLLDEGVDGGAVSGVEWALDGERPRARRRACVLNLLAVCRELNLISRIERVFFAELDRIYVTLTEDLTSSLDEDRFGHDGRPGHRIHRQLIVEAAARRIIPTASTPDDYDLKSYRQRRNPSLQVVTAVHKQGQGPLIAEFDIDRGNIRDPRGFFIHLGEVLNPGRTDHLSVWEKLRETTAAPFLAYEVD